MTFSKILCFAVLSLLQVNISHAYGGGDSLVSEIKIYSRILDEERTVSIALPRGYEEDTKGYPVLYVLDAEGKTVFSGCVSTVNGLNEKRLVPRMLTVGIWNTNRNRDMIPVSVPHRPGSGSSENFLNFITDELMPYIKKNYRITDFSLLYGMSNSALFTLYALLERPETFDAYIASSPMIGHCPDYIMKKAETFGKLDHLEDRSLFMIYGTKDSQRVTEYVPDFQKYLESQNPKGFVSRVAILDNEGHVPRSSFIRGIRYIFSLKRTKS
jgi:predicted alpha/beta superfamily hydrolase